MGKSYRWLILLVFLVVNSVIIAWVWRNSQTPGPAPAAAAAQKTDEKTDEPSQDFSEHWGRSDKLAYDLIVQWNRAAVMKLDSEELPAAIESMPEAGCIDLPDGAVPIGSGAVPRPVKQDLDARHGNCDSRCADRLHARAQRDRGSQAADGLGEVAAQEWRSGPGEAERGGAISGVIQI
jgi:hypothetical protein